DPFADSVERRRVEGQAHAPLGAELVDQQRKLRALDVLEQQRGAAGLHRAVGDLRDLEVRIDFGADPNELAFALEQLDPPAQVGRRRHRGQSMGAVASSTASSSESSRPASRAASYSGPVYTNNGCLRDRRR